MKWKKLGRIVCPKSDVWWMKGGTGPHFTEIVDGRLLRIYIGARDEFNVSRVGIVDLDLGDMKTIVDIGVEPLFGIGEMGCFDENGASYPWLVSHRDQRYLYYVGWIAGGLGGFMNGSGLARYNGATGGYTRVSRAPMLPRTDSEPIGTGSLCVLAGDELWRMWYTSFDRWTRTDGDAKHYYNIKYATSSDGVSWQRNGDVAIDFDSPDEYAIGKPCVIDEDGLFRMWYSYRGTAYRIGYAESADGVHWQRKDMEAGIDVSASGWDSEMVEYAHVFRYHDQLFMTYCGNGYGVTGIGLAVAENA